MTKTTFVKRDLTQLQAGDVIIDPQGSRHLITAPVEQGVDEDGDIGYRITTDTDPQGRLIFPFGAPESIVFHVEVSR